MVLIPFRTSHNKSYKIKLEPTTTISQAKESLSKEIGNNADPAKFKLLFKAKMLKDDQTIESLHLGTNDFIFVHTFLPKQSINYGPGVYPFDSIEATKMILEVTSSGSSISPNVYSQGAGSGNQGDTLTRIFRHILEIEPRAIGNVVAIYQNVQPNVRENLPEFISQLGLNPASFDLESVRNRTAPLLDMNSFGMLIARACHDLRIDPSQFMRFPGSGAPPPSMGGAGGVPQQAFQPQQSQINQILAQFTPEEREAIERLRQLGNFPLDYVIEMYVAADKNENLAANLLLGN